MRVRSTLTPRRLGYFGAARGGSEPTEEPPLPPVRAAPTVRLGSSSYPEGASPVVSWTASEWHAATDWIGLYVVGGPPSPSISWKYVPEGSSGNLGFPPLPIGGPYEARYYLEDGYTLGAVSAPFYVEPIAAPAPPPPESNLPPWLAEQIAEAKRRVNAAVIVIAAAVGPVPMPGSSITALIRWAKAAQAAAADNPQVAEALRIIDLLTPDDAEEGGLLDAIRTAGETVAGAVADAGRLAGAAIRFVAGDLPSPDDYEPENLCVTAWTNVPKFLLLSAVATIVFPPAVIYMSAYAPPSPVGITLGIAQAMIKGGPKRVVDKILDPLFDAVAELAGTLIDYAFNGNAALVRWALRRLASRLPEGVPQAIILALSEASDAILDAIKDISALKDASIFEAIGAGIEKVSGRFGGELQAILEAAGAAIKAGSSAVAILIDKGPDGLREAFDVLTQQLLGIPANFASLPLQLKKEIAALKVAGGEIAPIAMFGMLAQNLRAGIADIASATEGLPIALGDAISRIVGPLDQLVGEVQGFIAELLELAAMPQGGGEEAPPESAPPPAQDPGAPAPGKSSTLKRLLLMGAGGLFGAAIGGPPGAIAGAGAGAFLGGKE